MVGLVEIPSFVHELVLFQDFAGHRKLTLNFEPVTFSMSSVSSIPVSLLSPVSLKYLASFRRCKGKWTQTDKPTTERLSDVEA